jgi:transcriptional regulator with XRE-family HTH domain
MRTLIQKRRSFLIHIGKRLKSLRLAANMEIKSAAKSLSISAKRLEDIENGERNFRLDLFVKMCDFYGADVHKVLP